MSERLHSSRSMKVGLSSAESQWSRALTLRTELKTWSADVLVGCHGG